MGLPQYSPRAVFVRFFLTSPSGVGGSGLVRIVAPDPCAEIDEFPLILAAITFA